MRPFKQLNIERIAEDTRIRLEVTDAHNKCEPYNRELKRLNDLRASTHSVITVPGTDADHQKLAEISKIDDRIRNVEDARKVLAEPIIAAYTRLLSGHVGEEEGLEFDPKCEVQHRTENDKANREIKSLVRKIARDIDSFAHHYIPDELDRFTTPQAVENGQKAIVLATDYLDELWRAARPVTFAEVKRESRNIWSEYFQSFRRPASRQASSHVAPSSASSGDQVSQRRPGEMLGASSSEPVQNSMPVSLREIEMTAVTASLSGQTTAAIVRQRDTIEELSKKCNSLEAKLDQVLHITTQLASQRIADTKTRRPSL